MALVPALMLTACGEGSSEPSSATNSIGQTAQPPADGVMRYHYANEHERQYGDLFLPTDKKHDGPVPLVVFIHGGGCNGLHPHIGGEVGDEAGSG